MEDTSPRENEIFMEDPPTRENEIFRAFAGVMMVALILFGLLELLNVIHV